MGASYDAIRRTRGAAAPGSPGVGDRHIRSDLEDREFVWNGTYWLSAPKNFPMHNYLGSPPFAAADTEILAGSITGLCKVLITRWAVSFYVGGTNNSTNYWQISLRRLTSGISVDTLVTQSTQAAAGNAWTKVETTSISSNNPLNLSDIWLQVFIHPVLSPAAIYIQSLVEYKDVMP